MYTEEGGGEGGGRRDTPIGPYVSGRRDTPVGPNVSGHRDTPIGPNVSGRSIPCPGDVNWLVLYARSTTKDFFFYQG